MALRKRGKAGFWHAYFRIIREDGSPGITTINLGVTDKLTARAIEAELMAKNRSARNRHRLQAHFDRLDGKPVTEVSKAAPKRKRLRLDAALEAAAVYRPVGATAARRWRTFIKNINVTYCDEVTPEMAFGYLDRGSNRQNGKSYNNDRSALNGVFKTILLEAGMSESPFALIPSRQNRSIHQRPFTEAEFVNIYRAAPQPWKSACLIAWYTGMREKDCFSLRWEDISGDVITITPAKTARFGRAVRIPMHPALVRELAKLPRVDDRVLGAWPYNPERSSFARKFAEILRSIGVVDNSDGKVCFNSFRNSFITRCDQYNVPRHATRGVVGQVDDNTTDLYSHDLDSARAIQPLPGVDLD